MKKIWLVGLVPGCLLVGALAFVVVLLLVKVLWAWTVPDLFPGAVQQGLVAAKISWLSSFKLALFAAVLLGISGARGSGRS